ncbi:chorismate-binding protein [Luteibaculum oceani]|uniref:chorismate-binding protein n=1 Tax=Luteibaculum oceani TaxID=1294296 RepID=UPI0014777C91|nr:chorismate-binding protein [Luteibaculum oceani]
MGIGIKISHPSFSPQFSGLAQSCPDYQAEISIAPFSGDPRHYRFSDKSFKGVPYSSLKTWNTPSTSKEDYLKSLEQAISQIKSGNFEKVVLSRRKFFPLGKESVSAILSTTPKRLENKFCYHLHLLEENKVWIGATPEILLSKKQQDFLTFSLAGTALSENDFGPKEFEEQEFVTKYIIDQVPSNSIKVSQALPTKFKNLFHLKSEITWHDENNNATYYLNKLHPTPAVCGIPRSSTQAFIIEEEQVPRELYTGYIYIKSLEKELAFVNLRCGQLFNNGVLIYAGGGITADSNPEAEWQETENKINATLIDIINGHE